MFNKMPNTCLYSNCKKAPSFGLAGTKMRLYCADHKRPDDINVKAAKCEIIKCLKNANYGFIGLFASRCRDHKESKGMLINPRKKCMFCKKFGLWGLSTKRKCDDHRAPTDKNLIEGRCASCGLEYFLNKDELCEYCGKATIVKTAYLAKQRRVAEVLNREFKIEAYDEVIDGGVCSKKRPDFVIDGLYRKIVVEVDEFQHQRGYGMDCEVRRMWDIAQATGTPTVFVRYNPDIYLSKKRKVNPSLEERESTLVSLLKKLQNERPNNYASAVYLYYDGYSGIKEDVLPDPFDEFSVAKK